MLISRIGTNYRTNNYNRSYTAPRKINFAPSYDTVCFSGKVTQEDKKPQLKEKTIYIFLGAPASGKGTHASQLAKNLNIAHISTGDMLRDEIKNETKIGLEAKDYMNRGELVPTELFKKLLINRLNEDDCKNGFILDGFPRTKEQAEMIDDLNQEENAKIKVIQLVVDEDKLLDRMMTRAKITNRVDDTPEKLKTRIDIYNNVKDTLLDYYGENVVSINANGSIEQVRKNIDESIQEDLA